MKKVLFAIAALICVLALAACAPAAPSPPPEETADPAGLPNPFVEAASYQELIELCPGAAIYDVPDGSTNVKYTFCEIDGKPDFAQIDFTCGENTYQYRAKACESEDKADDMLHGFYYDFTADETVNDPNQITYRLRTYDAEGVGVATWYNAAQQCQYSLTTKTSQDAATVIKTVIPHFTTTDFG